MIRSMSARNFARRVVSPNFSNPVSVCCFIDSALPQAIVHQTSRVFQSFPKLSRATPGSPVSGVVDMSTISDRSLLILKLGMAIAALLLCASLAHAQPPAQSREHAAASAPRGGALITRDLIGIPGKEVVMSTIEVPPGGSS